MYINHLSLKIEEGE